MVEEIVTKEVQFERNLQRRQETIKWKTGNATILMVRKLKIKLQRWLRQDVFEGNIEMTKMEALFKTKIIYFYLSFSYIASLSGPLFLASINYHVLIYLHF